MTHTAPHHPHSATPSRDSAQHLIQVVGKHPLPTFQNPFDSKQLPLGFPSHSATHSQSPLPTPHSHNLTQNSTPNPTHIPTPNLFTPQKLLWPTNLHPHQMVQHFFPKNFPTINPTCPIFFPTNPNIIFQS